LESLLLKLKDRLSQKLPGAPSQAKMAPKNRNRLTLDAIEKRGYKQSAVLILFCLDANNELFIPLIERPAYQGFHSAQVGLPGGKRDPMDASLMATALRECHEEIGIGDNIQVAGELTMLEIPVSGYYLHPFVGVCMDPQPALVPNAREVKKIIQLKISDLLNEATVSFGMLEAGSLPVEVPHFAVNGYQVWGATAMVLSELKELLKSIF
jgi:8-oxo-dGTP pyrophosphatase MutT (NUDIX family)